MTNQSPAPVACTECGMVCQPAEFHPFAACLMFKGCHDGDKVRANLAALHPQAVAVEAERELFEPMLTVCGPTCRCGHWYAITLPKCPKCGKENLGMPKGSTISATSVPAGAVAEALWHTVKRAVEFMDNMKYASSGDGAHEDSFDFMQRSYRKELLAALAARPSPPTMLNGLTEAETCASASFAGLSPVVSIQRPEIDASEKRVDSAVVQQPSVGEWVPVLEYSAEDIVAEWEKGFKQGFEAAEKHATTQQVAEAKVAPRKPLTDAQIELLRDKTFSVGNPFCPVDSKSMRKVARAIERAHGIGSGSATEGVANG